MHRPVYPGSYKIKAGLKKLTRQGYWSYPGSKNEMPFPLRFSLRFSWNKMHANCQVI